MKPQDSIFLIVVVALIAFRKTKYAWHMGMFTMAGAGILFTFNNLFTSQRLSWYAAGFLFLTVLHEAITVLTKRK